MKNDFEQYSRFVNGYFFRFEYHPYKYSRFLDKTPFIFCIGPAEIKGKTDMHNYMSGLNLHHISVKDRILLLQKMHKFYDYKSSERRHVISEWSLNHMCPGCSLGFRVYNVENCYNVYRVKNSAVDKYISTQGDIYMSTPLEIDMQYQAKKSIQPDVDFN